MSLLPKLLDFIFTAVSYFVTYIALRYDTEAIFSRLVIVEVMEDFCKI